MILVAMQVAILGRQPEISLAELEAIYGSGKIIRINDYAATIDIPCHLPQKKLGGTIKSASILGRIASSDLGTVFGELQSLILDLQANLPEGKLQFGVSVYGFQAKRDWLLKKMLTLKKAIKKAGRSVRIIENKFEELEAAQVLYNKLTGPLGTELLIIKDGKGTIVAQTTGVQNIDAYAERDFGRPKRDSFVGMLPPKLAQIMLNLAAGEKTLDLSSEILDKDTHTSEQPPAVPKDTFILDPFCGTGVVLQEALLMGYNAYGTDISERMVEYSQENLQWLTRKWKMENGKWKIEVGDATKHIWDFSKLKNQKSKIFIVCETYLGKPLTALPDKDQLQLIINEANQIAQEFLKNLAPQIKSGTRLCIALPAWINPRNKVEVDGKSKSNSATAHQTPNSNFQPPVFLHLPMLDHLVKLGYNRLDFVHAKKSELIYHRSDQIVARELTILEKI